MIAPEKKPVDLTTPLVEAFEKHYKLKRLLGASASTTKQYHIQFRHMRDYLGREPTVADLNDETVAGVMAASLERGNRPATANKTRNHLLAMWRYFHGRRVIEYAPDVPKLPEPSEMPVAWTRDELARLLEACRNVEGYIEWRNDAGVLCHIPRADWWLALHQVLWSGGERVGAILQVRWSDVDLDGGWLIVRAELRKFRKQSRTYRLSPEAIEALRKIVEPERELVFHWPSWPTHIWWHYKRIRKSAGLPTTRRDAFHKMRRSVASYGAEAGVDPCFLMGHSSRQVTERSYLDPRIAKVPQAADSLFVMGSKPESED